MAVVDKITLKSHFQTGDKPTEAQFANLVDSMYNKLEGLGFVTTVEDASGVVESQTNSTSVLASSSTFSGWRSEIGDIYTAFRYLEVGFFPFNAAELPTQIKLRITAGQDGTLLAESVVNLGEVTPSVSRYISVDFGSLVSAGVPGTMLWVEMISDGRIGPLGKGGSSNPPGWTSVVNSQYVTNMDLDTQVWSTVSGSVNGYKIWARLWEENTITAVDFNQLARDDMFTNASDANKAVLFTDMPAAQVQALFDQHVAVNPFLEDNLGTSLGNIVTTPSWQSEVSTFSGWGTGSGVRPAFKSLRMRLNSWDAGNLITEVRVRVRDTNATGTILGDVLLPFDENADSGYFTVTFPTVIDNGSNPIWLEFLTNGRSGLWGNGSSTYVATQGPARYSTSLNTDDDPLPSAVTGNGGRIIDAELFDANGFGIGFTSEAVADMASKLNIQTAVPNINLPPKLYAVVGDTCQLFFRGIIEAIDPFQYNIKVTGNVGGKQFPRYYEFTPTSTATRTFTITLFDKDDNELVTDSTVVEIVSDAVAPASNLKVLCLGDSLTSAGVWTSELLRRLTGSGGTPAGLGYGNIEYIGTVGATTTNKREGYGGKTWGWFTQPTTQPDVPFTVTSHDKDGTDISSLWQDGSGNQWRLESITSATELVLSRDGHSNVAPATGTLTHISGANNTATITYTFRDNSSSSAVNPFWDYTANQLSLTNYITANGFGNVDVVYSLLSWNGFGPNLTEPADHATAIDAAKVWIDNLHAAYPSAKVKLMGIQLPSINGGLATNYGDATSNYGNYYTLVRSVFGLNKAYQEVAEDPAYSSFVEFLDVCTQVDSVNNMPATQKQVNTRNTLMETIGTNGVHPDTAGYHQIADVAFRSFAADYL